MGESRTSARRVAQAERRLKAIQLRKTGQHYAAIGAELGISEAGAFLLVQRELHRLNEHTAEAVVELRRLELERLDAMLLGLWAEASTGAYLSVDRVLGIMERRAKLLGLDAAIKQEQHGTIKHQIEYVNDWRGVAHPAAVSASGADGRAASGEAVQYPERGPALAQDDAGDGDCG